MSLKRTLIKALDRPGGRKLLSLLATTDARSKLGRDVIVFHDGEHWIHRINAHFFPDGTSFTYYGDSAFAWRDEPDVYFRNAETFWYKIYRPRPGDVVLDIGAGRGEDTLPLSRAVGTSGRVISVEAMPSSFALLKKLCALNHLDNVTLVHAAVSDKRGVLFAQCSTDAEWQADIVLLTRPDGSSAVEVEGVTIDELCADAGVGEVAFLKMNIEGAERLGLPGAAHTLGVTRAACICCHDFRADRGEAENFRTRAFVEEYLKSAGFEIRKLPYTYDYQRDHVYAVRG